MKAKQSQAAALFAAPLSKTARTLAALQSKFESQPGAAAAAPVEQAPAPAAEETEVVVEEVATEEIATEEIATEEVVVTEEETTEG